MFEWIADPQTWLAFATLTLLEIVLGIDNIIFLSLVVAKLPQRLRDKARRIGLLAAMIMRLALLATISWIIHLTAPLFTLFGEEISARDLILCIGGVFLIWKAIGEIIESMSPHEALRVDKVTTFFSAILQIMFLDIIFSLDSVITAVGLSNHLIIMMAAVIMAVAVMMFAARAVGEFVDSRPSVKLLALAFLILIGVVLILDSVDIHISKGYIYFAIFFSMLVECLNLLRNRRLKASRLQ